MSPLHPFRLLLMLINVCFADDLSIFARGDVESSRVIMDSIEKFKLTSGLLSVKYLGVPLISLGLLNRDFKILVEKVKNRIRDWKNKSLSFAGRLQLSKIAWDDICPHKCEGGLGLRNLEWLLKDTDIGIIPILSLDVSQENLKQWCDRNGTLSSSSVAKA
ncbi:hypothetical protein Tco_0487658 [Tanacetum coccineum]